MTRGIGFLCLAMFFATFTGCDSGPNRPTVKPAEGIFLMKGKPYAGVTLLFHLSDSAMKDVPKPRAKTEADGSYKLTTYAAYDGAMPGEYQVTAVIETAGSILGSKGPKPPGIPAIYQDIKSTTLTATVGSAEQNTIKPIDIP